MRWMALGLPDSMQAMKRWWLVLRHSIPSWLQHSIQSWLLKCYQRSSRNWLSGLTDGSWARIVLCRCTVRLECFVLSVRSRFRQLLTMATSGWVGHTNYLVGRTNGWVGHKNGWWMELRWFCCFLSSRDRWEFVRFCGEGVRRGSDLPKAGARHAVQRNRCRPTHVVHKSIRMRWRVRRTSDSVARPEKSWERPQKAPEK